MANISFYGSHNAAYVVEEDGEILLVVEVERLFNHKNIGMAQYKTVRGENILFYSDYVPKWIMERLNITEFENCYHLNSQASIGIIHDLALSIPAKNYIYCLHHESHAAGSFYQSPYKEALIFSFDGGGGDGKFNVYTCKRGESPVLLEAVLSPIVNINHIHYDLGFPYQCFGDYLHDIKYDILGDGNLVYPGKIMGLSSYGKVRDEWVEPFMDYYKSNPDGQDYLGKLKTLSEKTGIVFDKNNRLKGEIEYDVAATSQYVFEECFLEIATPYMLQYPDLPICITGGCGLNILLNTRLVEEFGKEVFVGPDPNDCGIALGMMLNALKPEKPYDSTYSGLELLDLNNFAALSNNIDRNAKTDYLDMDLLVDDLEGGKIVGVARGRAEHGARALGNRSILCNPFTSDMKDIVNAKVKHREWYRPFAPVVRLEDINKYFEWDKESRWMSFCPKVREEWREKLAAVTHVDGTARVQTVTREQNEWLYDLLTKFEEKTGTGVLLNTSFNVDGKPILSSIQDAFHILEKTQLDCLVIENYYTRKS